MISVPTFARFTTTPSSFDKLRQFIERQVALRRTGNLTAKTTVLGAKGSAAAAAKNDPMEMRLDQGEWADDGDYMLRGSDAEFPVGSTSDLFAMKGNGKGKGLQINGTCNYCGASGHMRCLMLAQMVDPLLAPAFAPVPRIAKR